MQEHHHDKRMTQSKTWENHGFTLKEASLTSQRAQRTWCQTIANPAHRLQPLPKWTDRNKECILPEANQILPQPSNNSAKYPEAKQIPPLDCHTYSSIYIASFWIPPT